MARYTGLPDKLRAEVFERDARRCRWCGATNQGLDIHHIEYRKGTSYDVLNNLVSLCRSHHSFVHGIPNAKKVTITKDVAQAVLFRTIQTPGTTGSANWRSLLRIWEREGKCSRHGSDTCLECLEA